MQKREGYRVQVLSQEMPDNFIPPPRECATLNSAGFESYLFGGSSQDTIKEISKATIMGDKVIWEKYSYTLPQGLAIQGR